LVIIAILGTGSIGVRHLIVFNVFSDVEVTAIPNRPERVPKLSAQGFQAAERFEDVLPVDGVIVATTDYADLAYRDVILIDEVKPVDDDHIPQYQALRAVLAGLVLLLKDGALVIVESTITPGTMAGLVRPLLEEASGKRANQDFYLGYCPERVMPGKLLANLTTLSRVVGGGTPETANVMIALYQHIVKPDLDPAELVKTVEKRPTAMCRSPLPTRWR
jgi:nucleotide sugar dehydrogenase